jgi:FAD/FMN-containing dehydrogenase
MLIAPYIMTHPSRPAPRALSEALHPLAQVTLSSDRASAGPWANARECWLDGAYDGARRRDVTHVLVCHDDAIPTQGLAESIRSAVAARPHDIISLFSTRSELSEWGPRGYSWIAYSTFCWGLGVVMPVAIARHFVEWCDYHIDPAWRADDTRITLYACANERLIYCTAPSLLQHPEDGHGVGGQTNDISPYVSLCAQTFGHNTFEYAGDRRNFLLTRRHKFKASSPWGGAL